MLLALAPLLILLGTTLTVLLTIAVRRNHTATARLTLVGLCAAMLSLCRAAGGPPSQITALLVDDQYARLFTGLIVATAAVVAILAHSYFEKHAVRREEFYPLLLLATIGCAVMSASVHFVSLFLGLEVLSVSLYAMVAFLRSVKGPLEAGIKYLILAAGSAAFLLFGMALIYADSGSLAFAGALHAAPAAVVLILVGLGFKLALVPFHFWTPDVYEGAPAPVAAFVATASKTAVFAVTMRFFQMSDAHTSVPIATVLTIIAIASMVAGNLLGLLQTNIKRLLAYSSIAHLGYMLAALVAGGNSAADAVAFYLAAYTVTTLGAFAVVTVLSGAEGDAAQLDVYRGLFWRHPAIAISFTGALLSLAGIPSTLGFVSKFYVLATGAAVNSWALMVTLALTSVIGLFYYLRVVVTLFSTAPATGPAALGIGPATGIVIVALSLLLIGFGLYPGPLLALVHAAVSAHL